MFNIRWLLRRIGREGKTHDTDRPACNGGKPETEPREEGQRNEKLWINKNSKTQLRELKKNRSPPLYYIDVDQIQRLNSAHSQSKQGVCVRCFVRIEGKIHSITTRHRKENKILFSRHFFFFPSPLHVSRPYRAKRPNTLPKTNKYKLSQKVGRKGG